MSTVGDIAESIIDGPFGSNLKSEHYVRDGARVIRLQNITDGLFDDRDKAYVSLEHFNALRRHEVLSGDVLIAALGNVLPRVCLAPPGLGEAIVKADCFRLRPHREICAQYVAYVLSAPQTRMIASTEIAGVGRPRLNLRKMSELPIPIPPLQEQNRIVAALEEQFSRLDAGVAAQQRIRRNLKRMRSAVLHAAVTGKLVPQCEDAAKARQLVEQLQQEARPAGVRKRSVPVTGHLQDIPQSWQLVALGDLAESITYGTSAKTGPDVEGVPVLRMGNIGWGTISYKGLKFLGRDQLDQRLLLRRGDLLFNRTNSAELVGKTAVFQGYPENISFASYLIRVRPLPSANLVWACLVLNSTIGRRYVASVRNQQVGQANVNGAKLASAPIPLPAPEEQSRIIAECDRYFSLIDALDCAAAAVMTRSEHLRSAILSTAFVGDLVPQDPADEPAWVLLKRIAGDAGEAMSPNCHMASRDQRMRTLREGFAG